MKDEWPLMQIMTEVVEDLDSSYLEEEQNGYSNESEGEYKNSLNKKSIINLSHGAVLTRTDTFLIKALPPKIC